MPFHEPKEKQSDIGMSSKIQNRIRIGKVIINEASSVKIVRDSHFRDVSLSSKPHIKLIAG